MSRKPDDSAEIDAEKLVESYRGGRHHEREAAEREVFKRPNFTEVRRSRDTPVTFRTFREVLEDLQALAKAENVPMVHIFERAVALYKRQATGGH